MKSSSSSPPSSPIVGGTAGAFTPGPWAYGQVFANDGEHEFYVHVAGTLHETAAEIYNEADARLIAAAPDLLTNLRHLVTLYDSAINPSPQTVDEVRAAIAKALGQSTPEAR